MYGRERTQISEGYFSQGDALTRVTTLTSILVVTALRFITVTAVVTIVRVRLAIAWLIGVVIIVIRRLLIARHGGEGVKKRGRERNREQEMEKDVCYM